MNRSADAAGRMRCVPADEDNEYMSIEKALAHLSTLVASRLKNTTKECNSQLQQIRELQKAVNEGEDKNAELRRELEEKNVELGKEVSSLRPCRS